MQSKPEAKIATLRVKRITTASICILAVFVVSGCVMFGGDQAQQEQKAEQQRQMTRLELNQGYSLLYQAAGSLSNTDKAFYVKVESDRVQKVVTDASDYASKLKADLERIAKDYPAVKIDLDPLPEIEKRKRASISKDTLKSLAPFVGKTGPAFERKLLLSVAGALDQLEFQCKVMADEEPVDSLRKFLRQAQSKFGQLYEADVKLLNQVYFKHDTYAPGKR